MKIRIQKWGHSLAVRIPKSFAAGLRFGDGSPAEMSLEEGAIVVRPDRDRLWVLDELLAGVNDDNLHPAWEAGEAGDEDLEPDGKDR
jgi:antitoxin MazE